ATLLAATAPPADAGTLDRIRESGVLRIGYRADAKPYSYRDNRGRPAGYIVDLCREVAASIGKNVRTDYVLVPADRRFEAVRDGKVDWPPHLASVTIERREIVDLSLPTYFDGASVIARSSRQVARFEDLRGRRIGVLEGTTSERTLRNSLRDLNLTAEVVTVG